MIYLDNIYGSDNPSFEMSNRIFVELFGNFLKFLIIFSIDS